VVGYGRASDDNVPLDTRATLGGTKPEPCDDNVPLTGRGAVEWNAIAPLTAFPPLSSAGKGTTTFL
jgi:hypothetical protein